MAQAYESYAELAQNEEEGRDYRIEVQIRPSPICVLAIHGGKIEAGTSELARAIAGDTFNLYLFEGLKESGNFAKLHVPSHLFDEPRALALAQNSEVCVSVHGFKEESKRWVALGGTHEPLKAAIFQALGATGLIEQDEINPPDRFPGTDPSNIVNRARNGGVQIEVSKKFRQELAHNHGQLQRFSEAIRNAIHHIQKS